MFFKYEVGRCRPLFLCQFWNGIWNESNIRTYIIQGSAGSTPAAGMIEPRKSSILGGLRGYFFYVFWNEFWNAATAF